MWADLAAVALHVGVVFCFAWLPAAFLARAGRRRLDALDEAPWPERARRIFPYRVALSAMTGGGMVAVAYLTATSRGPLAWSPAALAVLATAAAYLGITRARLGLERRVRRA